MNRLLSLKFYKEFMENLVIIICRPYYSVY